MVVNISLRCEFFKRVIFVYENQLSINSFQSYKGQLIILLQFLIFEDGRIKLYVIQKIKDIFVLVQIVIEYLWYRVYIKRKNGRKEMKMNQRILDIF